MGPKICTLALSLLVICAIGTGQNGAQEKRQYVVAPTEWELPVIAVQPGCPIQFEDVKVISYVDGKGGGGPSFRMRNRGTKPIRKLQYAWVGVEGGYSSGLWPHEITSALVMPGQLVPRYDTGEEEEAVPLTDEIAKKTSLRGPMQAVCILMVVKVEFADGTTYNAEPLAKALHAYTSNLGGYDDPQ
ncbi:MAG TPA: hypothetical protein VF546_23550 [Pyrinomonadaceae bacterium]|jgi:hypothetical protein